MLEDRSYLALLFMLAHWSCRWSSCTTCIWYTIQPADRVHDRGVVVDKDLTMEPHIGHVVRIWLFHLHKLCLIWHSVADDAGCTLIYALFMH